MKILYKNKGMLLFLTILLSFFITSVSAQEVASQITGRVLDESGEPLIGATVIVKGTMVGVATGADGDFSIRATPSQTLVFTYLGYEEIEITVGRNRKLNIKMSSSDDNTLEDIVVVGYGSMRKSDLTGSVASVSAEVFEDGSDMNFTDALQGQVAGVEVTSSSGTLGAAVSIRIRGSNSLGSTEPLYVIDGVIYDNENLDNFEDDGNYQSPLASINPSDIASMEILKDASATAIYGSEGSNGVILITTKSGQAGKPKVNLSLSYTFGEVESFYKVTNFNEYVVLCMEAYTNEDSNYSSYDEEVLEMANRGMFKSYNWQDIMTQTSTAYNATASVSGGSDDIKYMMSVNGYKTYGLVLSNEFQRISGRVNLTFNVNKKLKVTTNINLSQTVNNGIVSSSGYNTSGIMSSAITTRSDLSPNLSFNDYTDDELEDMEYDDYTDSDNTSSAYLHLIGCEKVTTAYISSANLAFEYEIITGLKLKVMGNYSKTNTQAGQYNTVNYSETAYDAGGMAYYKETNKTALSNEYTLSWNKNIGKNHKLSAVAGFSVKQNESGQYNLYVEGFPNDDYLWYNLGIGSNHDDATSSYSQSRTVSWFGRFNYTLNNKYLFTFTGRVDGNSAFADGNKYSAYPAGAFAWRVSEEPWLKGHRTISSMKLRASYGVTGNKASSSNQAQNLVSTENVVFGDSGVDTEYVGYANSNTMKNTQLTWETTTQASVGLDLMMFKNRLTVELEGYYKYTDNLLVSSELADHTGYTTSYLNYGSMYNIGVEFAANYIIIQTRDVTLSAGLNISRNLSVVDEIFGGFLNSGKQISWLNSAYTAPLQNGLALGSFWGYIRDGVRQIGENDVNYTYSTVDTNVGDQKYIDTNGDGILDENDKQVIGQAQADFSYGMNVAVSYQGFSLRIYGAGKYGNDIFNISRVNGLRYGYNRNCYFFENSYRWTPDNPTNDHPRLTTVYQYSRVISRRFIEDGTYFRIKTISFSYKLPDHITSRLRMNNVNFSFSITNPFTFTNYTGYNPDASISSSSLAMGHDNFTNPTIQSYAFGLNLQF